MAFQNSVHVLLRNYAAISNKGIVEVDGNLFFNQVEQKNPLALRLLNDYCVNLSRQIVNLAMILDPEVIVIGGGISERVSLIKGLQGAVTKNVAGLKAQTNLKLIVPKIVQSELGNDANLFGATIVAK